MSDMVDWQGRTEEIIQELRAEIERLRAQNAATAAFLDGLADTFDMYSDHEQDAADCRAMAAKLRGKT